MINCNKNNLIKLATAFRSAIEKADPKTLGLIQLQDFPYGACGDAALLLAHYLKDQECGQFDYVLGQREGHSHAWLEGEGLTVDITADQFKDQKAPVVVTENHSWHASFEVELRLKADLELFGPYTAAQLRNAYEIIKRNLN